MLTSDQISFFETNGYLVVEDAVTEVQLAVLRADFAEWVEESRQETGPYGAMIDGQPRFDVEPGHSAERPALRRVSSPWDVSAAHHDVMTASGMVAAVAELIGPYVKTSRPRTPCRSATTRCRARPKGVGCRRRDRHRPHHALCHAAAAKAQWASFFAQRATARAAE